MGLGVYFIDVLACLLFSLSLALVGASFARERTLRIDPPAADPRDASGSALPGPSIGLRQGEAGLELSFEGERVSFEELEARLRRSTPAAVVVRSETSPLARVVALAHAAGVHDIELAYAVGPGPARAAAEGGTP